MPTAELEPITETYVQADEVRVCFDALHSPRLMPGREKGRHGDDVRGVVGVWETAQGREVWAIQHLHEASARVGGEAVSKADCG